MGLSGLSKYGKCIVLLIGAALLTGCAGCSKSDSEPEIVEDNLVWYPGRTFNYKLKFNDLQVKQHAVASAIGLSRPPKDRDDAASMRKRLVEVKTNDNYIVDSLTHSVRQARTGFHRRRMGRYLTAQQPASLPVLRHFRTAYATRHPILAVQRKHQFCHAIMPLLRHDFRPRVYAI